MIGSDALADHGISLACSHGEVQTATKIRSNRKGLIDHLSG
jgi:hypothetical protein